MGGALNPTRDSETQAHKKRGPWEDKGRDWSDGAINQGKPRMASKPSEAGERQGRIPLQVSEGTWPC